MYVFYNSNGKIIGRIGADSPNDKLTYTPHESKALYFDDNEYSELARNSSYYTIVDNIPVYTPIPDEIKLLPLQQSKIEEINLACNQEILGNFFSSCTGTEHTYKFDMEYQANLNQQMGMLNIDETILSIPWPTVDNGIVIHNRSQFIDLLKDASDFKTSKLYRYFDLKAQVMNCQHTDEVKLIQW